MKRLAGILVAVFVTLLIPSEVHARWSDPRPRKIRAASTIEAKAVQPPIDMRQQLKRLDAYDYYKKVAKKLMKARLTGEQPVWLLVGIWGNTYPGAAYLYGDVLFVRFNYQPWDMDILVFNTAYPEHTGMAGYDGWGKLYLALSADKLTRECSGKRFIDTKALLDLLVGHGTPVIFVRDVTTMVPPPKK